MSSSGPTKRKSAAASATPESTAVSSQPASKSAQEMPPEITATTKYLILFNLLSFIMWYCVIVMLIVTLFLTGGSSGDVLVAGPDSGKTGRGRGQPLDNLFGSTYDIVLYTQTVAILEIIHTAIGLVRAGILTTAMQVASRLFIIWGVLKPFGTSLLMSESYVNKFVKLTGLAPLLKSLGLTDYLAGTTPLMRNQAAYAGMIGAWAFTECIRYMFFIYFLGFEKNMHKVPGWLAWLRYNTFFVLYPIGISCECWLIYHAIPIASQADERLGWVFMAILGIYAPGSYILYTHMIKQRARIMATKQKPKARTQ